MFVVKASIKQCLSWDVSFAPMANFLKVAKKFTSAKEFYLDNYLEVIECSNIGKSV